MVFSANAVESGANNFEAFKALAIQQNGTANSSTTSAAMSTNVNRGAGVALSIVAMFFGFLL